MNMETFEVETEYERERLDRFLNLIFQESAKGLSRSFFKN